MNIKDLASFFDSTYLKVDTTKEDIIKLIDENSEFNFYSLCIPPTYVDFLKKNLGPSPSKITTVIGFPFSFASISTKIFQTKEALDLGADEIDVVAPIYHLKNNDYLLYEDEIARMRQCADNHILKVIIETAILSDSEIVFSSQICEKHGVDFIKTSTGFTSRGASLKDIQLIRNSAPNSKIKASGGIKTLDDCYEFIEAGVNRIGSSNSFEILNSFKNSF